jgi:hypothetical protein
MADIPLPSELPRWATTIIVDPVTNAPNIVEPTESKKDIGWNAFEPPARNYFNWFQNLVYQWLNYFNFRLTVGEKITDGNGSQLFGITNSVIMLFAVDKVTPANYIQAMGFRGTSTPTLHVTSSNVLTLGSGGADGSQAISGGTAANIIVFGKCLDTTSA